MSTIKKEKDWESEAEDYYIQFWFCKNRVMLKKGLRGIYDEAFEVYKKVYLEAKEKEIGDLNLIGEKFRKELFKPKICPQ